MEISTDFENFDMQKCQDVSLTIGRRDMYYSSLDSSHQGESNGSLCISLESIVNKLFIKILK